MRACNVLEGLCKVLVVCDEASVDDDIVDEVDIEVEVGLVASDDVVSAIWIPESMPKVAPSQQF